MKLENFLNLVTDQGDLIEVAFSDDCMDELLEDFRQCQERNGYWNVGNWSEATCSFKGITLNEVNMSRIIGLN